MLMVTGTVRLMDGDATAFAADLDSLASAARRRPGNLFFSVEVHDGDVAGFRVVELWRDQPSLSGHLAARDTADFIKRWGKKMIADIRKYDVVNQRMLIDRQD
ncbi:putative quinol monooxygenase [Rhizobium sp. TRM95796]|uniref:putative quinol monooxygenase n=1 Tax=Rhizobium sp. TRM95796 TaxID=2979862 RepID=UPI0021E70777|nr:antibiotic biosynthesis monooxygenase [Rhizobium sp. TRM95796]MCV3764054.1 antibiotic biosynthesis monooxygenase [Rhizobium sp. TRM95796]